MTTSTRHVVSDGGLWGLIQNRTCLEPSDSVRLSAIWEPEGQRAWKEDINKRPSQADFSYRGPDKHADDPAVPCVKLTRGLSRHRPSDTNTSWALTTGQASLNSFSSYNNPTGWVLWSFLLTDEGAEVQRSEVTCPKVHTTNRQVVEQAPGVGDGQASLAGFCPQSCRESDMTEWLNWTELRAGIWKHWSYAKCGWGETGQRGQNGGKVRPLLMLVGAS